MASAGDASAREYLQRLVRDYPGDNAMDARYAELPDKASTVKAPPEVTRLFGNVFA
jgi:hypothetical protein